MSHNTLFFPIQMHALTSIRTYFILHCIANRSTFCVPRTSSSLQKNDNMERIWDDWINQSKLWQKMYNTSVLCNISSSPSIYPPLPSSSRSLAQEETSLHYFIHTQQESWLYFLTHHRIMHRIDAKTTIKSMLTLTSEGRNEDTQQTLQMGTENKMDCMNGKKMMYLHLQKERLWKNQWKDSSLSITEDSLKHLVILFSHNTDDQIAALFAIQNHVDHIKRVRVLFEVKQNGTKVQWLTLDVVRFVDVVRTALWNAYDLSIGVDHGGSRTQTEDSPDLCVSFVWTRRHSVPLTAHQKTLLQASFQIAQEIHRQKFWTLPPSKWIQHLRSFMHPIQIQYSSLSCSYRPAVLCGFICPETT